jgi:hypothetical protein
MKKFTKAAAAAACLSALGLLPAAALPANSASAAGGTEPPAAPAQTRLSDRLGHGRLLAGAPADCAGGIIFDDGSYEDAVSVPLANGIQVMSFTLPANAAAIQQVCVALTRLSGSPTPDLAFNVVFYAADGAQGTPGTLLGSVPATATAVPITSGMTIDTQFYAVAIGAALTLPESRNIYVGLQFDGSEGFFIGVDESAATPYQPAFVSTDGGVTWQTEANVVPAYRAYGLRVQPQLAQTNCVPSTTAMCLQGQRFEVTATFMAAGSPQGDAQTVPLTTDSGYLWFFANTNVEAIVKVLDACSLNQHFWVFAGGLTNVATAITVTDTQTGASRTYKNPLNTPFAPLQDTAALPCP